MLAHCCLQHFKILPSVYMKMSREEKAFIAGSLLYQQEIEEKARKESKRKAKKK